MGNSQRGASKTVKYSPAEYVIYAFGGVTKLAKAIGRCPSSVSRWPLPKSCKGCDGYVPREAQRIILQYANENGLDVTAHDLILGRDL